MCKMDNTLATYKHKVEEMIEIMGNFSNAIRDLTIEKPRDYLEEAVRQGFPEDKAKEYIYTYMEEKIRLAGDIVLYIDINVIPYLKEVSHFVGKAINTGNTSNTSLGAANVSSKEWSNSVSSSSLEKNNIDLEKALGIKKGRPMTIAEADRQNANPLYEEEFILDENGNYFENCGKKYPICWAFFAPKNWLNTKQRYSRSPNYKVEYHINCATCAIAYALRLRGFNVSAKGNVKGSLNRELSESGTKYFDVWKNADGTRVQPAMLASWARDRGKEGDYMSSDDYKTYFEETCKEKGVYIVTVMWRGTNANGHATILQRDENGGLYYIEPQVYESKYALPDGRRPISDLADRPMEISEISGILRVDDKIFDTKYAPLFNTH